MTRTRAKVNNFVRLIRMFYLHTTVNLLIIPKEMSTKLTLTVEKSVIEKAKRYAKSQGRSLSSLIENYLKTITIEGFDDEIEITPSVKSISGSFKLPDDFNYKEALTEALTDKYLKNG